MMAPVVLLVLVELTKPVESLVVEDIADVGVAVEVLEAVQNPGKLLICYLEDLNTIDDGKYKGVYKYFEDLQNEHKNMKICTGIPQLLPLLHTEIQEVPDSGGAYKWWRDQSITISGAPEQVLVGDPIPYFSLRPARISLRHDLYVGPVFLSGDCTRTGTYFTPPILFFGLLLGVALVVIDIFKAGTNRQGWVFVIYIILLLFCLLPLFELRNLLDTRKLYVHPVMKPILASRAFTRVSVYVCGPSDNAAVCVLRQWFNILGNGVPQEEVNKQDDVRLHLPANSVKIVVLDSCEARDRLFSGTKEEILKEFETSILIWSPKKKDDMPFTDDPIGRTLMQYLVLVQPWEKDGLAKSIMTAVSSKVVQLMHTGADMEHRVK